MGVMHTRLPSQMMAMILLAWLMSRFGTAVGVFGEGPPPLPNWSKDKEHYILLDERESAARGSL